MDAPVLRPYQVAAVEALRERFRAGARRVIGVSPTGSGKTVLFCHIIESAVAKGSRALVLAHRRELIAQTSEKLNRFGVRHGIIQAGFPTALHQAVQVASVQTIIRRPGLLQRVDLVVVDECHHVTEGNQYSTLLSWWPGARILGVTATPWRLDGKGLADVFPEHVVVSTPAQLRDQGYLCPVGGWEYEALDTSSVKISGGDFAARELARAAAGSATVAGNVVAEWLAHAGGRRSVLFACSIEHSQYLVRLFRDAGVAAEHVDGEMPAGQRDAILARLRAGDTRVVSNCNVLTEGFDCPELEVAVLCRPTLSTSLALQMVGRVLRPAPGKDRARIHDHAGILRAHGHPYQDRDFSPESAGRVSRKEAEEREDAKKTCPKCNSVIARWPCDGCGYAPSPEELQVQFLMEEAAKREIGNEPSEPAPTGDPEVDARRRRWREAFRDKDKRKALFLSFARKHGSTRKAKSVYRWFSGELEWPPRAWSDEAEQLDALRGAG